MSNNLVTTYLDSEGIITNHQHGFVRGRSCLTNLLQVFEDWTSNLDEGYGVDVIYLDYKKTFDTVPHKRLVNKMEHLGFIGLLNWLKDGRTDVQKQCLLLPSIRSGHNKN